MGAKSWRNLLVESVIGAWRLNVLCLDYYFDDAACLNIPLVEVPRDENSVALPRPHNSSYLAATVKLDRLPPDCVDPIREAGLSIL